MTETEIITALAALAQETRLRILRFLVTKGPSGASAGEIGKAVGAAASRASFHLATLADAGLVSSERQSRSIIYRVDFKAMGALTGYLVHECCKDHEDVVKCC